MTAEEWNATHPATIRPANPFNTDGGQTTRRTARRTTTNAPAAADPETADQATAATDFAALLRNWERAYTTGEDVPAALRALASACALSVVKKCADPQRKTAEKRETVSDNGMNPAMVALRRGIIADNALLDNVTAAHNAAYKLRWTEDGMVTDVADQAAESAAAELQRETLSDGIDLVNTAACAILRESEAHATENPGWMEAVYTARRLSKHVLIKRDDSAKWEDVETSPIREVYRTIRRAVQENRAVQTDPRSKYLYLEELVKDPAAEDADVEAEVDTIYRRFGKWVDIGGYTHDGDYTVDAESAAAYLMAYDTVIEKLNLTDRQARIINLRMSGYGLEAIGTYLGVHYTTIQKTLKRMQKKCIEFGFAPAGENKARIELEKTTRWILETIATADQAAAEDADRAFAMYEIAYGEAEKHGITSAALRRESENIAREVSATIRKARNAASPAAAAILYAEAEEKAEKYCITSKMLNNV